MRVTTDVDVGGMVDKQAERRLLDEIRAGQREACAELVRSNYESVYRLLCQLSREPELAEDLTQETFAAVWQSVNTFQKRSSIRTWLYRIAYRKFVDCIRKRRRQQATARSLAVFGDGVASAHSQPAEQLLQDENKRRLYHAVQSLDEDERTAIVLHYLHGLAYREMAHVLGVPQGTLQWRTSQALDRLRKLLTAGSDRELTKQDTSR